MSKVCIVTIRFIQQFILICDNDIFFSSKHWFPSCWVIKWRGMMEVIVNTSTWEWFGFSFPFRPFRDLCWHVRQSENGHQSIVNNIVYGLLMEAGECWSQHCWQRIRSILIYFYFLYKQHSLRKGRDIRPVIPDHCLHHDLLLVKILSS